MTDGSYHIERYRRTRFFALYDKDGLLAVTAYKKGASAVKERLEAQDRTIAALREQFNGLNSGGSSPRSSDSFPTPSTLQARPL
jgi:hypothetical protein